MVDMDDLPIAEYDGLSETPERFHHSSRYQSKIEGSELIPTKLSVKPNLGLSSPYQGKTAKAEIKNFSSSSRRSAANRNDI